MEAFLLVFLVVFLFLQDFRSTLIPAIAVPVSIIGTFFFLSVFGYSINLLTLFALVLAIGIVVDDAIVVCENIYSYLEEGLSPKDAAVKGVSEIAVPVIATVLTTVFAFFPIVFMKEIIGQFLRVIPIAVISMLLVSLFEAIVILPIHAEEMMKPTKK